ncbi:MAG: glycosyltransferase family 4 protein [Candidatus Omnitrophica bacterium]|nr:glycosyltransferase family 4 protein [Candidatus Omnitrophota bacterium]
MNILFLSTHLNAGGITSYLFTMSKGLIRRGHQVHVATSGGNMEKEFSSIGVKLLTLNIRTKSELDPKIYFALSLLAKYIRENEIDLIHAQTRVTQVMGAWLKKLTGKPFISTCHGFFKTRLSRRVVPCWGDCVIAISTAVEKHLKDDFKVREERVFLIESGIDLEQFSLIDQSSRKELRARFDLGNAPVVGIVARLSDVKGQDILVEAMSRIVRDIPDAQLLLVGEGKMERALRENVERLNLNDHVRFFSIVDKTYEMLSLFDIFAMPSRQEGLGLSIMEAQAAGLPVVASRVGGIPSLIEDGNTGVLVEPENPDELAGAIVKLFGDRARMNTIGMAGREFIKETFSADKMLDKVIYLYQQLAGKNHETDPCC